MEFYTLFNILGFISALAALAITVCVSIYYSGSL